MAFSLLRLFLFLAVNAVTLAAIGAEGPAERFSVLKTDDDVFSMDLSEDQKQLLLAHRDADRVTIWDIVTNQEVAAIDTPSPAFVLCRGSKVFVANYGKGLVTVFDGAKKWEKVAEVKTRLENVAILAAPNGKAFKGQLLALCDVSEKERQMLFVDTNSKKSAVLGKGEISGIAVDYDGKNYFWQGMGGSPARPVVGTKSWPLLVAGRDSPLGPGTNDTLPILRQTQPGQYWFGGNLICKGMPPAGVGKVFDQFVIGDRSKQLAYVVVGTTLDALELKGTLEKVGSRNIEFPKEYHRFAPKIYANPHVTHLHDFQNIAVTGPDGKLRIYVYECFQKLVWTLTTEAFPGDDVRGQKDPQLANNTNPVPQPMEIVIAPVDKDMRMWSDATGSFRVEAKFLQLVDDKVKLQKADGKESLVPLAKLSAADQAFVKSVAPKGVAAKPVALPVSTPMANDPPAVAKLAPLPSEVQTTSKEMDSIYDKVKEGDAKFKGKMVEVSGVVRDARFPDVSEAGSISVTLGETDHDVACVLDPQAHEHAQKLWPGQKVKIVGKGDGWHGFFPALIGCQITEIGDPPPAVKVDAKDLLAAYAADRKGANEKYYDKTLLVDGVVAEVELFGHVKVRAKDAPEDSPQLMLKFFTEKDLKEAAKKLKVGDPIRVRVVCRGQTDFDDMLTFKIWRVE